MYFASDESFAIEFRDLTFAPLSRTPGELEELRRLVRALVENDVQEAGKLATPFLVIMLDQANSMVPNKNPLEITIGDRRFRFRRTIGEIGADIRNKLLSEEHGTGIGKEVVTVVTTRQVPAPSGGMMSEQTFTEMEIRPFSLRTAILDAAGGARLDPRATTVVFDFLLRVEEAWIRNDWPFPKGERFVKDITDEAEAMKRDIFRLRRLALPTGRFARPELPPGIPGRGPLGIL